MGIISLKTPIIICVFNPTNINMKIQLHMPCISIHSYFVIKVGGRKLGAGGGREEGERRQKVEKVRMSKGVGDGGGRRRREQEGETVG